MEGENKDGNKEEIIGEQNEEKKDEKGGYAKGNFAGIGAALGIAAIGVGGKMLYDKFSKKKEPEPQEKIIIKEDSEIIQKFRKQRSLKPKIITDELDKNYLRVFSIKNEDEEEIIKVKNSFICPISQIMMSNPVITPYGTTYEKSEILKWINQNNNDYITKKPLTKEMLVDNYILKATMTEYEESLQ